MINEIPLIGFLELEADNTLKEANRVKAVYGADEWEYNYLLGWLNGIEHAAELVKKLTNEQTTTTHPGLE